MRGIALADADNGAQLVFRTGSGILVGRWRGDAAVAANDEFSIELDVERDYNILEFEKISGDPDRFESLPGGSTVVFGRVDEIDFQGVLALRVGGGFLSFDTEGEIPLGLESAAVRVVVDDLQLYPTGI
jgi:hypothetical protein